MISVKNSRVTLYLLQPVNAAPTSKAVINVDFDGIDFAGWKLPDKDAFQNALAEALNNWMFEYRANGEKQRQEKPGPDRKCPQCKFGGDDKDRYMVSVAAYCGDNTVRKTWRCAECKYQVTETLDVKDDNASER